MIVGYHLIDAILWNYLFGWINMQNSHKKFNKITQQFVWNNCIPDKCRY